MEIKLIAGDALQVPAGCMATIKENTIVIEKREQEFKDGDILYVTVSNNIKCPFIYKGIDAKGFYMFYVGIDYYGTVLVCTDSKSRWGNKTAHYATEEEKQAFFDDLKAKGLRWNAETKEMEKVRKRAKDGEKYLHIIGIGRICEFRENYDSDDNQFYNLGNYYLLSEREEAEEDAKAIRAIFEKRKKVIQE